MRFLNFLRKFKNIEDNPKNHLLRIEISAGNLNHNLQSFCSKFPNHKIGAVLKSNAYGHGLKEIGLFLDKKKDVSYLIVDSIIEASFLRDWGISKPIIILGYVPKNIISRLKEIRNMVLVINSLDQAQFLKNSVHFPLNVHIKVDTGMNRQGVEISQLEEIIKILLDNHFIKIDGLLSHLADADSPDEQPTHQQIEKWSRAINVFKKIIGSGIFHLSASSGVSYLSAFESNLIRVGIGLYGFDTTPKKEMNLKPVLSMFAKVVNLKRVLTGEKIGYNFTHKAERETKIAVVPCGYYEGVNRLLSNRGYFYFKNQPLKILGRVSMNLTTIDVSSIEKLISIEDEVEVFSSGSTKENSIENVAKICQTIPYEIVSKIPSGIKRVIK